MRRHLVTKGSFYERLANHGDEIVSDDDFADLYAPRMGRPSIPPSVMVRAMLCATHDKTSDEETSRRTRVDADWKAAMGVDDDFQALTADQVAITDPQDLSLLELPQDTPGERGIIGKRYRKEQSCSTLTKQGWSRTSVIGSRI